jgi:hypothetical protein
MRWVIGLLLALAFVSAAQAEDCKVIHDAAERLACFDQPTKPVVLKKLPLASDPELEKLDGSYCRRARLFNDSDSVSDASSGRSFPCLGGGGHCVCLEVNAKNAYGGYTGIQTVLIEIDPSGIPKNLGGNLGSDFPSGKMTPFPQLNGK